MVGLPPLLSRLRGHVRKVTFLEGDLIGLQVYSWVFSVNAANAHLGATSYHQDPIVFPF